jgi:predicted O-methyltransferase YrrM
MKQNLNYETYSAELDAILESALTGEKDSDRHGVTLFSIALASRSKTIIELGVRQGHTSLPLLMAAKLNGTVLHSVDREATSFVPPDSLGDSWNFYQMDAIQFLEKWESDGKGKIDFIYIDDWHSYEHVKTELAIVDRLVGPSSVILLHDLMYGGTEPFYHSDLALKQGQWGGAGHIGQ